MKLIEKNILFLFSEEKCCRGYLFFFSRVVRSDHRIAFNRMPGRVPPPIVALFLPGISFLMKLIPCHLYQFSMVKVILKAKVAAI